MAASWPPADPLTLLTEGEVSLVGRMPWSSNATYLVELCHDGEEAQAVYKPVRGERPLWDFPSGLHKREIAAYVLSEALGWGIVPPTVLREDAPLGEGSLQLFVPSDFEQHYFTLHDREETHHALMTIAVFDLIVNNTDRKSGHCLLGLDGHIYAIDNGLCFAAEPKLRTVIWEFGGEPIPAELLDDVARIAAEVPPGLRALLDPDEVAAVKKRAKAIVARPVFPVDSSGRRYPWPMV
ncbi:MAG TPA: SCO1664 family protein [Acidimicrobiales bacterium]|nr:SCO1664 family protein [Acidimicrobiales bacterium]